jgi:Spy/CpxP family protein refolding chaperone
MTITDAIAWSGALFVGVILVAPSVCLAAPPTGPDDDGRAPSRMDCHAQRGPGPEFHGFAPREPEWGPPPGYLADLTFTEEQQDKIFGILYAVAPAMREQAKALRKAREALDELATTAQYEQARVRGLVDSVAKADSEIMLLHARTEREIYLLLTPAQREKMPARRGDKEVHRRDGLPPH